MTTYVIREWVGDHENVNTPPVHTPHVVLVALESVFNVAIPNNALAWLTILNIGSQIMMVGKRGEKIDTTIQVVRIE